MWKLRTGARGQLDGAEYADEPFLIELGAAQNIAQKRVFFLAGDVECRICHVDTLAQPRRPFVVLLNFMPTVDDLRLFPIVVPLSVEWGDQDSFAHVNNTV